MTEYRGNRNRNGGRNRQIDGMELRYRRQRMHRRRQKKRMLISAIIEVLILLVLAVAFCWNKGMGAKATDFFGSFDSPPVKELDVSWSE